METFSVKSCLERIENARGAVKQLRGIKCEAARDDQFYTKVYSAMGGEIGMLRPNDCSVNERVDGIITSLEEYIRLLEHALEATKVELPF